MAKLAVFGCLEKYLFTLFCFELRKAQKSHCAQACSAVALNHIGVQVKQNISEQKICRPSNNASFETFCVQIGLLLKSH